MRRIYPSATREELLEAFPRRSMGQIYDCAARYNVKRKKEPHSTAGFPIIEQIKLRAKKCNISMKDLDAMARTTPYFASGRWRFDGLNRRSVYRAIEALDGEVTIVWR
ncbi:uncharacterized protein (DUF433 family) [Tardiphaga robiniae]|uniref:hypothetical protein n=1 Tax=Tardiphaga robiniae TaxID=943830 RepID=UPI002864735D|nr:hypothetical protein [Tardiphaga robiniae]MDR6659733.1 uncharacterized protein (DUF433 family) [Tardiphaga robiniae]